MDFSRRDLITAIAATAPMAFSGRAVSQSTCGPGLVVVRVETRREIVYVEAEISIGRGFGATIKTRIPTTIVTSAVICEPPKPPPPKGGKPKAGWDPGGGGYGGYAWFQLDSEGFEGMLQGFAVRTRLPSFTRLSATGARLTTTLGLADGATASFTQSLRHDGQEFRVADVSSIRGFTQTYAPRAVSFAQQVSDVEIEAFADGADTLSLETSYLGHPLHTVDRMLHVSSGTSAPPGTFDPQRASGSPR